MSSGADARIGIARSWSPGWVPRCPGGTRPSRCPRGCAASPPMADQKGRAARAIARGILAGWFQVGVSIVLGPLYTLLVLKFLPRDEAGFWMVLVGLIAYVNLFDVGLGPT